MIFNEDFFNDLPVNKYEAGQKICKEIIEHYNFQDQPVERYNDYSSYIDAYAALDAFLQHHDLNYVMPKIESDRHKTIESLHRFCQEINIDFDKKISTSEFENARNKYNGIFENGFIYKFTDGDLSRIQELINELRDSISSSQLFDANHKERLLNKLEGLQKELHKKMSSIDKFWGLVGDAGIVLGKFGQDAKPLVDRISEIAQIIWRTQANAEELPSGTSLPLLKSNEKKAT
ncbi:hypothetical protein [Draconibacterium sediminis]|uniref:hypothetical protein n=1 Tax=Draconibacterium sediminis TaxID=1544798 RepID=UPI0006984058|nr:hypothetical protein [Draconibacterium sediminis]